ncbi:DUF2977 domain-containing protein [Staphylococcus pseudoxylosus]|uniref:DUF2977 domain-containing protein n=1 Tax=Staphylococcus pseudoxylosus TaxID=2282419 RepID=A0AAQ0S6N1_9STAP|nr:DUF2977 domain-containing protein [Staphylococcus pseudoxylosus]MCE5003192.1 DUF2977 domain-containing protein [Staphylococcus pseudoxylosus]RMI85017.1 DUF2977 domain-containing protein [Staphylococcus pseudoxylosus]
MRILVNSSDIIIAFAIVGGFDGDIEISDEGLPSNFVETFKPGYYLYRDGEIKVNTSYKEESETMVIDNPPQDIDSLRIMVATLQKQSVQSNLKIVSLENKFKELEEKLNKEVGANE